MFFFVNRPETVLGESPVGSTLQSESGLVEVPMFCVMFNGSVTIDSRVTDLIATVFKREQLADRISLKGLLLSSILRIPLPDMIFSGVDFLELSIVPRLVLIFFPNSHLVCPVNISEIEVPRELSRSPP